MFTVWFQFLALLTDLGVVRPLRRILHECHDPRSMVARRSRVMLVATFKLCEFLKSYVVASRDME